MSRIGRAPITVPAGVTVTLGENNLVTVKGKLGTLTQQLHNRMILKQDAGVLTVERPSDDLQDKALHGLTRSLLANMIEGVTNGYSKKLEIVGVGYRALKSGKTLTLNIGYSHPVIFEEKDGITFEVPDANTIIVKGIDNQKVGQIAAQIREKRPPEPYLGKGIKYSDEHIRRKAGKTGK
ncbi:MAG: 50S ribosomal protein L6 [Lachnospiraceae bacterium]|nr:50S ribosomal protein L6 [Lachnospiraceae bacterium]